MPKFRVLILTVFIIILYTLVYNDTSGISSSTNYSSKDKVSKQSITLIDIGSGEYYLPSNLSIEPGLNIELIGIKTKDNYSKLVKQGAQDAVNTVNKYYKLKNKNKIKLNYKSTKNNIDDQIDLFDEVLYKYPDSIIITMADINSFNVQFDMALDNGIHVISAGSSGDNENILSQIKSNYNEQGDKLIDSMSQDIESNGNILLLSSSDTMQESLQREEAIINKINSSYPGINVYRRLHYNKLTGELINYKDIEENKDISLEETLDLLMNKEDSNIKGIISCDGDMSKRLLELSNEDKLKGVSIYMVNDGEDYNEMLDNDNIKGLLLENPYAYGYASAIAAIRASSGAGNESVVNVNWTFIDKNTEITKDIKQRIKLWEK